MRERNRMKELTKLIFSYMNTGTFQRNLSVNDLSDMILLIEHHLRAVDKKIEEILETVKPQNDAEDGTVPSGEANDDAGQEPSNV